MNAGRPDPGEVLGGRPFELSVVDRVESIVASFGEATIRTTKTKLDDQVGAWLREAFDAAS